jgi:hypothetical protein
MQSGSATGARPSLWQRAACRFHWQAFAQYTEWSPHRTSEPDQQARLQATADPDPHLFFLKEQKLPVHRRRIVGFSREGTPGLIFKFDAARTFLARRFQLTPNISPKRELRILDMQTAD